MFSVVGEQYRPDSVAKALRAQLASPRSKPHTAVLVQQSDNPHDPQAVAVYFRDGDERHHVGFLPRADARVFREQMKGIGWNDVDLEVLACVTEPQDASHPQVSIYLPTNFGDLCCGGYHLDPGNCPQWLANSSTAPKRPDGSYSDDELRRIYCQYAQSRKWAALPDAVEARVQAWRSQGLGPLGLALKSHEDGEVTAISVPKSEIMPASTIKRRARSTVSPEVTVSIQNVIDLDGVLCNKATGEEFPPFCTIFISCVQMLTSDEDGRTLLPESYFSFSSLNEKNRLSAAVKVPCDQMHVVFTKLWDATLAIRRQAYRKRASTQLVSINASKDCAMGCSMDTRQSIWGMFRIKRQTFDLNEFWHYELVYLFAKVFQYMKIETDYTPKRWLEYTNHTPHQHGGKITI